MVFKLRKQRQQIRGAGDIAGGVASAAFITARRSAGRAASRVLAVGLVALALLLPSTVFLMWLLFPPPLFVYDVFMVKAPVVLVLLP